MKPAILITQCLQNDFVKVIGQHDPLPNKLHIGYDEVVRLFGDRPDEGMLLSLMKWAYEQPSSELRIINIRDWHDPEDRVQKKHLEQFGIHCVKNTNGAEFVFERYRKPDNEVIINASGLNDFVETGLEAVLAPYKGQPMRVGIIGVWTEAKVSYLCYDIASRFPSFDIAVCSGLTASSSTHMHYVALDQLKKILNVKIYPSVTEFANFLADERTSLPLGKDEQVAFASFHFDEGHSISKDDMELLSYLFRNSQEVHFKVLDGGFSGNVVMKATATDIHGHEELPTVIKIGDRNLIAKERDSFEKVQDVLGNNAPSIVGYLENESRAAIKYRYASMFDEKVTTFQQFYGESNDQHAINGFLDIVFKKQLGRFYKAATLEQVDLLSYYDFSSKYAGSVERKVEDLIGAFDATGETINVEGKECYNLAKFYKQDLDNLEITVTQSHYMAYLHGDLNGANIIIDARDNVWLIDFFHTHRGHVLKDLIKLENDVTYIFMKINSKEEFEEACGLIDVLLDTHDLWEELPNHTFRNPQLQKAYNTIKHLRSYYPELVQLDRTPYQLLVGLMRYSVHTLSFDECNEWQRKLALYASCNLAIKIKSYVEDTKRLRFDYLKPLNNCLGMTILPGRIDRKRNLNQDLKEIKENGFSGVVTLITNQELAEYGVPDLVSQYKELGLDVCHISVPDQGIPTKEEMNRVCNWIDHEIADDKKVLLHCVGGLGRTGTVAACYLKQFKGFDTQEAIQLVRSSRSPRAIETKVQEDFVDEYAS